jgi:hypothetical protein
VGRIVLFHDVIVAPDGAVDVDVPAIVLGVGEVDADYRTRLDLGIFGRWGYGYIENVPETAEQGGWSWPPRIEGS